MENENDYYFDDSLFRGTVVIKFDPELLQAATLNQVPCLRVNSSIVVFCIATQ